MVWDDRYAVRAVHALAQGKDGDLAYDGAALIVMMARASGVKPKLGT